MSEPINIKINKRVFNDIFYKHLRTKDQIEVFYGGAASGKSYFVAQRFVYRMILWPGYNILAVRKISATNHDSTFALMCQVISQWGLSSIFKVNESKGDESISCMNNSQMLFKGMKDEKEREKIKSITFKSGVVNHIWIEEASEITEEDLAQLNLRLRGYSQYEKQVTLTFNPIRKTHWLKRRLFDRVQRNILILKTTYKNNRFLTAEDAERIESLKENDLIYYKIYCLGEWGEVGNVVFSNYTIEDIRMPYDDENQRWLTYEDYFDDIVQGMDFGYDHPSVFVCIGFRDGQPYWFLEIWERKLTNSEWIKYLEKVIKSKHGAELLNQVKKRRTIADSAEPARIKEFKAAGWNVHASRKGKESVRYGIDFLKSKRMTIDVTCDRIAEEVAIFRNKVDRDGKIIDCEYVDEMNDALAASRYACEDKWAKQKIKVAEFSVTKLGL